MLCVHVGTNYNGLVAKKSVINKLLTQVNLEYYQPLSIYSFTEKKDGNLRSIRVVVRCNGIV